MSKYPLSGGSYRIVDDELIREDEAPPVPASEPATPTISDNGDAAAVDVDFPVSIKRRNKED